MSVFKTPLEQNFRIGLIFEKNLKRKQKLDKKTYQKFSRKLNRKYEEQNHRNDKYFQAMDFFRFLFDLKRSHPFAQFYNKKQLHEIKIRAKSVIMQQNQPSSPIKFGNLQIQRRKFGSELNPIINEKRLFGSFNIQRGDSSKDQTITKLSNAPSQHSAFNGFQLKELEQASKSKNEILSNSVSSQDSSSSSSSSEDSVEVEDFRDVLQNNQGRNFGIRNEEPLLSDQQDEHMSFTQNMLHTSGNRIEQISRDFVNLNDKKQAMYGFSIRALIDTNHLQSSESGISVNNPVSDELNMAHDLNEYKHSLYDMINDTVVTISSIQEFDQQKDWLAQQVALDSSQSEGQMTIKELANTILIGIPRSPSQQSVRTSHNGIKKTIGSPGHLKVPFNKNMRADSSDSMTGTIVQQPRRHSMRGSSTNIALPSFIAQEGSTQSPSPSKRMKRASFRIMNNNFDMGSEAAYMNSIAGIIEKVREEEEEDIEEFKQEEEQKLEDKN